MPNRHRIGDTGEAAFVHKVTELGLHIARPLSDKESYDYIVRHGCDCHLVQVKTPAPFFKRLLPRNHRPRHPQERSIQERRDRLPRNLRPPEQTFYILRQKSLARRVALSVPSARRQHLGPFAQYHERWGLLLTKKRLRSKSITIHASAENTIELVIPTNDKKLVIPTTGGICS